MGAAEPARRVHRRAQALIARVLTELRGLDRELDYVVPDAVEVAIGSMVRVPLGPRRVVGGWVVALRDEPDAEPSLKPLAQVRGIGPGPELIGLARWAAWRWAGSVSHLLTTASPATRVRALPSPPAARPPLAGPFDPLAIDALGHLVGVLRLPPAADLVPAVLAACARGSVVVVCASVDQARLVGARVRRAGIEIASVPRDWARAAAGGCCVIGARSAVWAPCPDLAAIVVLDEHDEAHQQEQAPTWHARDVAIERARRAGVPCLLVSPCPTLEALAAGVLVTPTRDDERAGWPVPDVVDRRRDVTPGPIGARLGSLLSGDGPVVVVVNRTGRARLVVCQSCGAVARCERCTAAVSHPDETSLHCGRCGLDRPVVCQACGRAVMSPRKPGTARLVRDVGALATGPVVEVTAALAGDAILPPAHTYVGTEAVLHRLDHARVVAFVDLDDELLAPRHRAAEQALALVVRAARLVGPRAGGGRVLVQTRSPDHEVVQALLLADPDRVTRAERVRREALGFAPFAALALVSGAAAEAFVSGVPQSGVEVLGPADGRYLIRASDHRALCDALAAAPRPAGRLRVEVDPLRV